MRTTSRIGTLITVTMHGDGLIEGRSFCELLIVEATLRTLVPVPQLAGISSNAHHVRRLTDLSPAPHRDKYATGTGDGAEPIGAAKASAIAISRIVELRRSMLQQFGRSHGNLVPGLAGSESRRNRTGSAEGNSPRPACSRSVNERTRVTGAQPSWHSSER